MKLDKHKLKATQKWKTKNDTNKSLSKMSTKDTSINNNSYKRFESDLKKSTDSPSKDLSPSNNDKQFNETDDETEYLLQMIQKAKDSHHTQPTLKLKSEISAEEHFQDFTINELIQIDLDVLAEKFRSLNPSILLRLSERETQFNEEWIYSAINQTLETEPRFKKSNYSCIVSQFSEFAKTSISNSNISSTTGSSETNDISKNINETRVKPQNTFSNEEDDRWLDELLD